MNLIRALIYCLFGLFSTLSDAAPVRWNLPGTVALSGNYTISGSFTADFDIPQLTSSDLVCWRRLNLDHLCRLNFDQGLLPAF